MSSLTQNKQIKAHLDAGGSITPKDAYELYGSFRLAARIKNLRDAGMNIQTLNETSNGKRYARYMKVV